MIINRYKNVNYPTSSGKIVSDFFEKEHPLAIDLLYVIADLLDNKLTKKDFINLNYGNKKEGK